MRENKAIRLAPENHVTVPCAQCPPSFRVTDCQSGASWIAVFYILCNCLMLLNVTEDISGLLIGVKKVNDVELDNSNPVPEYILKQSRFSVCSIGKSSSNILYFFHSFQNCLYINCSHSVFISSNSVRIAMLGQTHGSSSFLFQKASPREVLWAGLVGPLRCVKLNRLGRDVPPKLLVSLINFSIVAGSVLEILHSVILISLTYSIDGVA